MIKIYHNPRCRKSREGLLILENSGKKFDVIKYLDNPLTFQELSEIIELLKISPVQLVRKNEKIWKENYKNKDLNDKEIIQAMVNNPKLIERPVVVYNSKAVIGRPPENILKLF
ncbi:MAG: arsenate reductase (glutaredoxin) [Flavobacteriaceae bacterium]|nr:arsenate reductase (glutaredoxin) [Flavobacteriaceae bacterium]